jgi:hypothetical protein
MPTLHPDDAARPAPATTRRGALRTLAAWAAPSLAAALLPACGGGGGAEAPAPAPAPAPPPTGPQISPDGLPGRIVRRLRNGPAGLIAATDDGAWRRGAGGGWARAGLSGTTVLDLVAVSAERWLVSAHPTAGPVDAAVVLETTDAGASWHPVDHDFGGAAGREPVHTLLHDAAAQRLLATGASALAQSLDHGRSWQLLTGQWRAFSGTKDALAFDPALGDVWFGGQDAIEGATLVRRRADGTVVRHDGLLPAPATVKAVRFGYAQPARLLVAGEGGIVETRDHGASWRPLLADANHRFYFDVMQDVLRPQRLVTAGWDKNFDQPQPLVLEISDDDGATWQRHVHPDPALFGGAWSLTLTIEDGGRRVVYVGLYRGGVMRVVLPD